ncbi:MAG: hypothetical protein ACFFAK_00305 [Promethearchaeota archaeon]
MNSEELYNELNKYFSNNLDIMRHLKVNACWEYFITENSLDDENSKLHYYLIKKDEDTLELTKNNPKIKPDLILYFTERAILNLIKESPNAEEYYHRYRKVMDNPRPELQVDNKINKPRLKLWQIGYKKWQEDFKF